MISATPCRQHMITASPLPLPTLKVTLHSLTMVSLSLDLKTWPPIYPSEPEWLFQVFSLYLQKIPKESFEAPSLVALFQAMHGEFVSDWLPEVMGLRDHVVSLVNGMSDSQAPLFAWTATLLSASASSKVPARRQVSIIADDSPSEESFDPIIYEEQEVESNQSTGLDIEREMDPFDLVLTLPPMPASRSFVPLTSSPYTSGKGGPRASLDNLARERKLTHDEDVEPSPSAGLPRRKPKHGPGLRLGPQPSYEDASEEEVDVFRNPSRRFNNEYDSGEDVDLSRPPSRWSQKKPGSRYVGDGR